MSLATGDGAGPGQLAVLCVAPLAIRGGVSEVLRGYLRWAGSTGVDASAIILRPGPEVARLRDAERPVDVLDAGSLRDPARWWSTTADLARMIRQRRPDVVLAVEPSATMYVLPALLSGVPVVMMQHGRPASSGLVDRLAVRLPARQIICPSDFVAREQRALTSRPVTTVYPGADSSRRACATPDELRAAWKIPIDARVVLMVGRLQPWKGQDLFLRAAAQLADINRDAVFVVVGGSEMGWEQGDYPTELRRLVEDLHLTDRVRFVGGSADVAAWYAIAELAVHASDHEPFGLVVCEAMLAGVPTVTVAQGGPLEIVDDGRTGVVVERRPNAIAAAVQALLEDPDRAKQLGKAGRVHAEEHFTDKDMARRLTGVVRRASLSRTPTRRLRRRQTTPAATPKVLFVAPVAVRGGAVEVLRALVAGADDRYMPVVALLRDGPMVDGFRQTAAPVTLLDAGRLRSFSHFTRTTAALRRLIRRHNIDVVMSGEPSAHLYAGLAAASLGVPALWRQPARPTFRNPVEHAAMRVPARCVVTASRFIATDQRRFGSRPIRIIPPGIDFSRFDAADGRHARDAFGIPHDAPLITIVGRLQEWKGQEKFLHMAVEVLKDHPSAHFALVGGADLAWDTDAFPQRLRRLSVELGIDHRVTFTGSSSAVGDWHAASDVIVHASDHEPFGLVIPEAMSLGRAVVTVPEGGPPEIVEHGRTGLIATARSSGALAVEVRRLLADPALRSAIGSAARSAARARFSQERMCRDFAQLFEEACL